MPSEVLFAGSDCAEPFEDGTPLGGWVSWHVTKLASVSVSTLGSVPRLYGTKISRAWKINRGSNCDKAARINWRLSKQERCLYNYKVMASGSNTMLPVATSVPSRPSVLPRSSHWLAGNSQPIRIAVAQHSRRCVDSGFQEM
jgi:hypothetical protein